MFTLLTWITMPVNTSHLKMPELITNNFIHSCFPCLETGLIKVNQVCWCILFRSKRDSWLTVYSQYNLFNCCMCVFIFHTNVFNACARGCKLRYFCYFPDSQEVTWILLLLLTNWMFKTPCCCYFWRLITAWRKCFVDDVIPRACLHWLLSLNQNHLNKVVWNQFESNCFCSYAVIKYMT